MAQVVYILEILKIVLSTVPFSETKSITAPGNIFYLNKEKVPEIASKVTSVPLDCSNGPLDVTHIDKHWFR